ncbi:hypothetical protein Pmani_027110 [Petrolisthes manimaculis]|uniref:Uncharacterized protein n=1 Tax=Petrolisthes manimaculis TaxID=1843537 RepID=A0AAE1TZF4_9EUCA|nr:hypothetical protein Pmani_027110 [Petrolisthes manimaculis]
MTLQLFHQPALCQSNHHHCTNQHCTHPPAPALYSPTSTSKDGQEMSLVRKPGEGPQIHRKSQGAETLTLNTTLHKNDDIGHSCLLL